MDTKTVNHHSGLQSIAPLLVAWGIKHGLIFRSGLDPLRPYDHELVGALDHGGKLDSWRLATSTIKSNL